MNPDPDEHVHPGEESLQWGEGVKESHRDKKPQSRYWAISEQARKMIPGESQCKMFCGGKSCKYCTAGTWTPKQMAVDGLYSEWVTPNILAMARMSNFNIRKFNMIKQLQDLGVKTIINLQQSGEHAYCGYGNDESGFSYNPQTLMDEGFYFYNFAMADYGVAPMATLLDIVKVTQFAVSVGKVAVHCHAGLGRTGLIIACYLIYNNRVKASKAVQYVRSRRPGSIQTKQQVKICHEFDQYIKVYYIIFSSLILDSHAVTFSRFLVRQRQLLHGYESRKLKHIPKVIYVCCERLLELCGKGQSLTALRNTPIDPIPPDLLSLSSTSYSRDASPCPKGQTDSQDTPMATPRLHARLGQSSSLSPNSERIDREQRISLSPSKVNGAEQVDAEVDDDDDDACIIFGKTEAIQESVRQADEEARKAEEEEIKIQQERSKSPDGSNIRPLMSVQEVCEAIVKTEYSESVLKQIRYLEEKLNKSDEAWKDLAREEDPLIICGVMCDWLEQLHEPVLRAQDVTALVGNANDLSKALLHLEKSTKHFLEYIIRVLSKFEPLADKTLDAVLEFFLAYLCHKRLGLQFVSYSSRQKDFGELSHEQSVRLFKLFLRLLDEAQAASSSRQ